MPLSPVPHVRGLVLAAGSGSRLGGPKALLRTSVGEPSLVERAVEALVRGGCDGVTVVVGAAADEVVGLLARLVVDGSAPDVVRADDWAHGMGASLRAGLTAFAHLPEVDAALVTLVDLPDVGPDVIARILAHPTPIESALPVTKTPIESALGDTKTPIDSALADGRRRREVHSRSDASVTEVRARLSRAAYSGVGGHPVFIGRDHWAGVVAAARGDWGARDYLAGHAHDLVECGDLATGRDLDTEADLDR